MPGWFTPLDGKAKYHQLLAFDVEGIGGAEGFLCGSIVGDTIYEFHTDRKIMREALLTYGRDGYRLYSHNLQYDLPLIEGGDFPMGELLFTRASLLWADYQYHGKKVRFYDSLNLFPRMGVAQIGRVSGLEKLELPEGVLRRIMDGTAWSSFNNQDQEAVRRYCCRDSEIVYLAVSQLQDILNHLGGELKATISGCAMDLYRRIYHKWPWIVLPEGINKAARKGYHGGRCENYATGLVEGVNAYDVTSLYPALMRVIRFPLPQAMRFDLKPGITGEWQNWEGIVYADVEVPDCFTPMLPYKKGSRSFYPVGRMEGAWPICEVLHAVDYGAKLHRVEWALGTDNTFNPFVKFVEDLYKTRQFYLDECSINSNVIKLLLNSLYGRFGLEPEGGLYTMVHLEPDTDYEMLEGYTTHVINDHVYAYGPKETTRYPDYANVFFAAQITGSGRMYLLDEMVNQGEKLIYCDTDSILTQGVIPTREGLGGWRCTMESGSADLLGPKEYALHNQIFGDAYHAKGIPDECAEEYIKTGAARFFRAIGLREALGSSSKPSQWVETLKTHRQIVMKRYPAGHPVGQPGDYILTYPWPVSELSQALEGERLRPDLDQPPPGEIRRFPGLERQARLFLPVMQD